MEFTLCLDLLGLLRFINGVFIDDIIWNRQMEENLSLNKSLPHDLHDPAYPIHCHNTLIPAFKYSLAESLRVTAHPRSRSFQVE